LFNSMLEFLVYNFPIVDRSDAELGWYCDRTSVGLLESE